MHHHGHLIQEQCLERVFILLICFKNLMDIQKIGHYIIINIIIHFKLVVMVKVIGEDNNNNKFKMNNRIFKDIDICYYVKLL